MSFFRLRNFLFSISSLLKVFNQGYHINIVKCFLTSVRIIWGILLGIPLYYRWGAWYLKLGIPVLPLGVNPTWWWCIITFSIYVTGCDLLIFQWGFFNLVVADLCFVLGSWAQASSFLLLQYQIAFPLLILSTFVWDWWWQCFLLSCSSRLVIITWRRACFCMGGGQVGLPPPPTAHITFALLFLLRKEISPWALDIGGFPVFLLLFKGFCFRWDVTEGEVLTSVSCLMPVFFKRTQLSPWKSTCEWVQIRFPFCLHLPEILTCHPRWHYLLFNI